MDIVPSFMQDSIGTSPTISGFDLRFMENHLRIGQIMEVYAPSHARNLSKRVYEYEVLLYVYNENRSFTTKKVTAVVSDTFGAIADSFSYTPRKNTANNVSALPTSKGSLVLVLCVNSDMQQSVIVGGYPNNNLPPVSEDLGHHLSFEFNGVRFNIDRDGQVVIQRRGPTNDDGTVVSGQEEYGGATVLMTTDGNISIQSGNGNHVKVDLDATNGSLNLSCTEGVVINSGQYSMVQGENLATAITSLMTAIATATTALGTAPMTGASLGGIVNTALGQFQPSSFLSAKNKVD
jgi:hypothetical protein